MWRKDPLLLVILWWTALVAGILVWLPLVRGATQGTAYRWALADGIGGQGVGGAYWLLIVGSVFVFSLLYLGWRGARQPFHWLLLGFHVPLAAAVAYAALTDPQRFRFEGATIGVDVSLALIGPVLFCGVAVAAIAWVVRDLQVRRSREPGFRGWTRAARIRSGFPPRPCALKWCCFGQARSKALRTSSAALSSGGSGCCSTAFSGSSAQAGGELSLRPHPSFAPQGCGGIDARCAQRGNSAEAAMR